MRFFFVIAAALLFAAGSAAAQTGPQNKTEDKSQQKSYLYQWTDDKGVVHISDSLGNVPMKYRGKALIVEESETREEPAQGPAKVLKPSGPSGRELEDEKKADWQDRMKAARLRLADAQRRYRELSEKRSKALDKWGYATTGSFQGEAEIAQITKEMERVQKEIDVARDEVENVIPEEARKAGVPPGWLRE